MSPISAVPTPALSNHLDLPAAIERACDAIAPSWPLDRAIAVNPMLGQTHLPFENAAAELAADHGVRALPTRALLRDLWRQGKLQRQHLKLAIEAADAEAELDAAALPPATTVAQRVEALILTLHEELQPAMRLPLITDIADASRRTNEPQPWSQLVIEQTCRHAAVWFDRGQASWSPDRRPGLFAGFLTRLAVDHAWPSRRGRRAFAHLVKKVPMNALQAITWSLDRLELSSDHPAIDNYFAALLGSVRGWAAWCAYERWQARLAGDNDDNMLELLAMRVVLEALLVEDLGLHSNLPTLHRSLDQHPQLIGEARIRQRNDLLLLRGLETVFQQQLRAALLTPGRTARSTALVDVEAVFCIDVRSERVRRALEHSSTGRVATRGFAGFFGLPIATSPLGAVERRPQLPGLFAPTMQTGEQLGDAASTDTLKHRRQQRLAWRQRWARFRKGPASAFSFVESLGLLSLWGLLRDGWQWRAPQRSEHAALRTGERRALRPCWHGTMASDTEQRADVAAAALRTMGLIDNLPRLILLVGHASSSCNNAHAAALDCGACGGQSGEQNARLLAATLEDPAVRVALSKRGINIPEQTRCVAGLHDTTTDEIELFVEDLERALPTELQRDLRQWLDGAACATRAERAPGLGMQSLQREPQQLLAALRRRAADWSEVRPEWGLADNAALVIAPRGRTKGIDLEGRVFLHDYHAEQDHDDATLTQLLCAPMVVANWINLHYYASVVDPRVFGSGNKLLHNVVGGRLGVIEGNGGDLRLGLPLQSVHDGQEWRHTPVRLSVFVEAEAAAIDRVLAANATPRQLVENGWLHLFRITKDGTTQRRTRRGVWLDEPQPSSAPPARSAPTLPTTTLSKPPMLASSTALTPGPTGAGLGAMLTMLVAAVVLRAACGA